ncbi:MAG: MFS transporter [Chloroflexi bacterium]|nr:MFS transporter [Chloroflexota bacterium]
MNIEINKNFRYNFIVNVIDGGFFGSALGFASFVTILPLFVSTLTDSALLIGLTAAIHSVGWQLPQLLTADRVARLTRYKPMVILMTLHERLPFLGLAAVAWLLPTLGYKVALPLTFGLLIWQGLGGGFTATAWQSMIGKIIPVERRGTFFGTQSAAANFGGSLSAIAAGILLARFNSPANFTLCFLLAGISMLISWIFLAQTRESESPIIGITANQRPFRSNFNAILRRDVNFRWFLVARMLAQLATMASSFYTVYVVRQHGMSGEVAGLMTGVFMATQVVANPLLGWVGDRWGHRTVMGIGSYAAAASALLAWLAPGISWFYLVFILAGVANVASWTIGLAMTLEFGSETERPAYIGLANTLVAPSTILAPLVGGWLADAVGYQATFLVSVVGGLATALVLQILVRDPRCEHGCQLAPICNN